jgi:hypothetical protein
MLQGGQMILLAISIARNFPGELIQRRRLLNSPLLCGWIRSLLLRTLAGRGCFTG